MSKSINNARLTFSVKLVELTEDEASALEALVGYGDDAFLTVFKEKLGKHYIEDHEAGLRSFFATVRREVLPALEDIKEVRALIRQKGL